MTVKVHKAKHGFSSKDVGNSNISIVETLPDNRNFNDALDLHKKDAVLSHHLPQGTRHQLLLLMLEDAKIYYRGV